MKIDISSLKDSSEILFMLHLSDKKYNLSDLEWWLPSLIQSQIGFSVLVRDLNSFKLLRKLYPNLVVLLAKSPVNIEEVIKAQPKLQIILYTENTPNNLHLLRFNSLGHIFIGSKDIDYTAIDKTYRAYDEIWVKGDYEYNQILKNLKELRHLKVYKIGTPQLKEIFLSKDLEVFSQIYKFKQAIFYTKPNIILNNNIEISKLLLQNIESNSYEWIKTLLKQEIIKNNIVVKWSNLNKWLLALNKPIFVYTPKIKKINSNIPKELIATFSTYDELKSLLNKDIKTQETEEFVEGYFGKSFTIKDEFQKQIKQII